MHTLAVGVYALCLGTQGEPTSCRKPRVRFEEAMPLEPPPGEDNNMTDLYAFLEPMGISQLRPLNVSYGGGVELRGAGRPIWNANELLGRQPTVSWAGDDVQGGVNTALVFVDIDCGGRQRDASQPGWCGPALHSLWMDCSGFSLETCVRVVPYHPPDVEKWVKKGTNRYAWILFQQPFRLAKNSLPYRPTESWDFRRFLELNPGLTPVACNFAHVGAGLQTRSAHVPRLEVAHTSPAPRKPAQAEGAPVQQNSSPPAQMGVEEQSSRGIPCCDNPHPEKGRAGRCASRADKGFCDHRCPVACGLCRICPGMDSLQF